MLAVKVRRGELKQSVDVAGQFPFLRSCEKIRADTIENTNENGEQNHRQTDSSSPMISL